MAIHIQDKETDGLVREFARSRGLGITEAIKAAVKEANQNTKVDVAELERRIAPILEEVRTLRKTSGPHDDKAFMDEMWGEEP